MTTTIGNASPLRQLRWVSVPMPIAQADALPDQCLVDNRWLAVKAQRVGDVTQMWHVRAEVEGESELVLDDWKPLPAHITFPEFELSPWLTDLPERSVISVGVHIDGDWLTTLALPAGTLVHETIAGKVYRFEKSDKGWHATLFATLWSGQDAVDIRGVVIWSDPNTPAWRLASATVTITTGGEPLQLYWPERHDYRRWGSLRWKLYQGPMPHGVGLPFHGILLPQDDTRTVPVTFAQQIVDRHDIARRDNLAAAAGGPMIATTKWDDSWMAFGITPEPREAPDKAGALARLRSPGRLFSPRPLANVGNHGATGMQPPFGAVKDLRALAGDPWRALEMLHSADDYWLRSCHLREPDGRRTTRAIRPDLQTWSGPPEPNMSPDKFGKGLPPYGWDTLDGRTVYMDDQHRGDMSLQAALALTGDPLLGELMLDLATDDDMRAMRARDWIDAPRASGRLWQSWAGAALLIPEKRATLLNMAVDELNDRESNIEPTDNGPVLAMMLLNRGDLLPDMEAWVPWNQSLAVLGALAQARVWSQLGGGVPADRFYNFARTHGRNIIEHGSVFNTQTGEWWPINGVKWLPGGERNPATYYTYPRPGAGTVPTAGNDMLVGEPGWWSWYSAALFAAKDGTDEIAQRARMIWNKHVVGAGGAAQEAEWWAIR